MRKLAVAVLDLLLLPVTCAVGFWVHYRQAQILRDGVALAREELALARALGVRQPERVRIACVPQVPLPLPGWAGVTAQRAGWLSPHIAGMTLGYGIVLRDDCRSGRGGYDRRLLAHELTHVAQYERHNGIHGFLRRYVRECVWPGYPRGPLEREAHAAAQTVLSVR